MSNIDQSAEGLQQPLSKEQHLEQEAQRPELHARTMQRFAELSRHGMDSSRSLRLSLREKVKEKLPGALGIQGEVYLDEEDGVLKSLAITTGMRLIQTLERHEKGYMRAVTAAELVVNPRQTLFDLMKETDHKLIPTIMETGGKFEEVRDEFLNPSENSINVSVWLGGGQGGTVLAAGEALAWQDLGLWGKLDGAVAVSSGGAPLWYGEGTSKDGPVTVEDGASIALVDNVGDGVERNLLFDIRRLGKVYSRKVVENLMDLPALMRSLHRKPVDLNRIRASKTQMYFGVTDANTGKGHMINVNSAEDPYVVLGGTINIPTVNNGAKFILKGENGEEIDAVDGMIACRPIEFAIKRFYQPGKKLNIMVFKQKPMDSEQDKTWGMLATLANWSRTPGDEAARKALVEALRASNELQEEELAYLLGTRALPEGVNPDDVRISYIAPRQTGVGPITQNPGVLKIAYKDVYEQTMRAFGAEPQRDLYRDLYYKDVYAPVKLGNGANLAA